MSAGHFFVSRPFKAIYNMYQNYEFVLKIEFFYVWLYTVAKTKAPKNWPTDPAIVINEQSAANPLFFGQFCRLR